MTILDRLREHNTWMTRELLQRCRSLTQEQFMARFAIGPGSLHDTFLHIVDTMRYWALHIGDRAPERSREEGRVYTIDELIERLDAAAVELDATAGAIVAEDRLDDMMEVTYMERVYRFTRGTALTHVLTHGMHHRAQIFNMFRQLGVEVDLDGDVIEWEIAVRS